MAEYSRTKKYRELREKLQSDTGSEDVNTSDLSGFESRLNRIDSANFKAPEEKRPSVAEGGTHARTVEKPKEMLRRTQAKSLSPSFDTGYATNENDTATFDNDYLNRYIKEVKDYNIAQGTADSENTSVNILRQLRRNQETDDRKNETPSRPYPKRSVFQEADNDTEDYGDTADIGFGRSRRNDNGTASSSEPEKPQRLSRYRTGETRTETLSGNRYGNENMRTDSLSAQKKESSADDSSSYAGENSQNMTKEDIMAEVQNLVNGSGQTESDDSSPFVSEGQSSKEQRSDRDYSRQSADDRTTRQQLLNETTQMRAQLDDYEDNLSEVSDKMRHTNRILNIVLVVLILALAIILGIVIYWIILSRG